MTSEPTLGEASALRPAVDAECIRIENALARSALFEALAIGFRPPSPETVERLAGDGVAEALAEAAELLEAPEVAAAARRVAASPVGVEALEERYARLFGHTARGEVSPCETEYGSGDAFRQPQELADVAGFYRAFGLVVAPDAAERPDHVACECEFAAFLARKEALALEGGRTDEHATVARAARLFLRDHLARFLPAFASRLERAGVGGFYGALGTLAGALVASECRRLGVAPGPVSLALRDPTEEAVPMACGSCALGAPDGGGEVDDG